MTIQLAHALTLLREGEETVTLVSPKYFQLTLDDHRKVAIHSGTQEIPDHLKDHWWLAANGATVYSSGAKDDPEPIVELDAGDEDLGDEDLDPPADDEDDEPQKMNPQEEEAKALGISLEGLNAKQRRDAIRKARKAQGA